MSKAFTKDDDSPEPVLIPPRAPLPDGVPNYVTPRGLALLLMGERIAPAALGGRKRDAFVRDVLSSIRFVVGPAQPAA